MAPSVKLGLLGVARMFTALVIWAALGDVGERVLSGKDIIHKEEGRPFRGFS